MKSKLWIRLIVTCLAFLVWAPLMSSAVEVNWPVYLNGTKTSLKATVLKDGTILTPMSFPVGKDNQEYDLSIHADAKAHIVYVQRKPRAAKLRGDEKCYHCSGTGKCQQCYPEGSGLNTSGVSCQYCSATGKCWYCEGTGDKMW